MKTRSIFELFQNEYYRQVSALSSDEVYEGLLGYGMFAANLPPVFTSEEFFEFFEKNKPTFKSTDHDFVTYRTVKNTGKVRTFGIPNPFAYQVLCQEIKDDWEFILKLFKENTEKDTYKVSRIHVRKLEHTKAIFEMNYKCFPVDGNPSFDLSIDAKYCVAADISSCFPSIYTHAIPWSFVGKKEAKATQHDDINYNRLDKTARNTTNSETHGILIGPHASNLLSEIVLTKVDFDLCKQGWKYIRYIDDYEAYTQTQENAESFLIDLTHELEKFGLLLNRAKCRITSLPIPREENWIRQLNNYPFPDLFCENNEVCKKCAHRPILGFAQVNNFLDFAIELVLQSDENTAILKYALKMVSNKSVKIGAATAYAKRLIGLCKTYPYLVPLLEDYVLSPFGVYTSVVSAGLKDLFAWSVETRNYEAASHLLFIALRRNIVLDKFRVDVDQHTDCIYLVLSYLYAKKNKMRPEQRELKEYAKKLIIEDSFDNMWLFIYSVLSEKDLKGMQEWSLLKKKKVSFIRAEYR